MHKQRQSYLSVFLFFCLTIGVFLCLTFFRFTPFAAQTADNVFRPLLGSSETIALESLYFALGDKVAAVQYFLFGPKKDMLSKKIVSSYSDSISPQHMRLQAVPIVISVPSLIDEGVWIPLKQTLYPGQTVIASTFLRPDPKKPYAVVTIVKMDMHALSLGVEAGTYYPGGMRHVYGHGFVPLDIQKSNILLAVFNGGFQEKDGQYGMIVNNKTYVPLRKNLATLVLHKNGSVNFIDYTGQPFAKDVVGVRQNGPFLVRNGVITQFVEQGPDTWGRTTTNSMYTWRSGIGITKNGNLMYAVGNSLLPQTLAVALQKAGAVDAMQLDINPFWVRFIVYNSLGNGKYTYHPLLTNMQNGGYQYLHGYNKDFFYVYKK